MTRSFWGRAFAALFTRAGIAAACAIASLWIFAQFSAEINEKGHLQQFDSSLLFFFKTHQTPGIHEIMAAFTYLAGPIPQAVALFLCVCYFAIQRKWQQAATLLFAGIGGIGVVSGLKALFHRPRPDIIFAPLGYSFPSGHSFFALVVYGLTAYFVAHQQKTTHRKRVVYLVGGILTFLVGFSRVYLGQHYPSDVGAGYAVAFFWVWACLALPPVAWRYIQRKGSKNKTAPISQ